MFWKGKLRWKLRTSWLSQQFGYNQDMSNSLLPTCCVYSRYLFNYPIPWIVTIQSSSFSRSSPWLIITFCNGQLTVTLSPFLYLCSWLWFIGRCMDSVYEVQYIWFTWFDLQQSQNGLRSWTEFVTNRQRTVHTNVLFAFVCNSEKSLKFNIHNFSILTVCILC